MTTPTTHIRVLSPDDAEAYFALRSEMLVDTPQSFLASPGDDVAIDIEGFREVLGRGPENVVFGVFDGLPNEKLLGSAGLLRMQREKAAHATLIWGVYVTPAWRRRGVARRVLDSAITHARALKGVTQVKLGVSAHEPGAQALYESLGFEPWGTEPKAMIVDGHFRDETHMVLMLER